MKKFLFDFLSRSDIHSLVSTDAYLLLIQIHALQRVDLSQAARHLHEQAASRIASRIFAS